MIIASGKKHVKVLGKLLSFFILFLIGFVSAGTISANPDRGEMIQTDEIEGIWQGTLQSSEIALRVVFTISKNLDSTWMATMDVPEQGAADIPVDIIGFDNKNLHLEIISIKGIYNGRLADDGETIDGQWTQGGMTLPLVLKRTRSKLVLRRSQEPSEPFPYRIGEVLFENTEDCISLAGTFTLPASGEQFPAVLLLSGSGPQDRDETVFGHRPFLVLADYLTRHGIAVLRVDDRGVGGSTGNFDEATAVEFASDAAAGIDYLKNRREIDPDRIGLIGHSEGGMIASLAAAASPDVAFIVLIASPGLPILEMEYSERKRELQAKGAGAGLIARSRLLQDNLFAIIRKETDGQAVEEAFTSVITEYFNGLSVEEKKTAGISEENLGAFIDYQSQKLHTPWFRFYLPFDPGAVLQKVSCPVLAINGEKDTQVVAKENLTAIENALQAGGNNDYLIQVLPNLNHLLQTAETGAVSEYGQIEETFSPIALQLIADWILALPAIQ